MNGKQNVVHPYNGILFSFFKEGDSDICYNIDEPDFMLSERSQSQKATYYTIPFKWNIQKKQLYGDTK